MDGSFWPGRFVKIGLYDTYEAVFGMFDGLYLFKSGFIVHDVLDETKFAVGFGVMWIVGDGFSVEPVQ